MHVQVSGTKFIRDTKSMGLINTDSAERNEYLTKVKMLANQKTELNNLRSEMESIKGDVQEIKNMLKSLIR